MDTSATTVPMHFVHNLFQGLSTSLIRRKSFLSQAKIPLFLLEAPHGRVTVLQFARLYRLLANEYDDETPGFFSRPLRGGTLKYLCLSIMDAPNLQVALHRFSQFFRLILDDAAYQLVVSDEVASMRFIEKAVPQGDRVLVHELMLKLVHGMASWLIAEKIPPLKISCAYHQPQHSHEYLYFYPGEVAFDQPWTAIHFDRKFLRKPIRQSKQQLSDFLQKAPADWMYVSFSEQLLAHRVRDHLSASEQISAVIQQVAQALHLSVRTLSRRLAAEGTHFQAVKDEVRRDFAIQQLTSSSVSLAVLAGQLGFEDLASFNRAFRNWTGSTPGTYRRGRLKETKPLHIDSSV